MSRSGTSAVAAIVAALGANVGPQTSLIPPNEFNPGGYWEQRPIYNLNTAILAALGGTYESPPGPRADWVAAPRLARLRNIAAETLAELYGDCPLWAMKDPRFSFTLPFWQTLVDDLKYIVCVRNPSDVAASFERFTGGARSADDGMRLWLQSTASAVAHTRAERRVVVFYDDLFGATAEAQISAITSLLGRAAGTVDVSGLVRAELRHRAVDVHAPRMAEELYNGLRSDDDIESIARAALDASGLTGEAVVPIPRRPLAVRTFPEDLANLEQYGIYDDGWSERRAFLVLRGGGRANLVLRGEVAGVGLQQLELMVNGKGGHIGSFGAGLFNASVPLPATARERVVELRWREAVRLANPDGREVGARLRSLRVLPSE